MILILIGLLVIVWRLLVFLIVAMIVVAAVAVHGVRWAVERFLEWRASRPRRLTLAERLRIAEERSRELEIEAGLFFDPAGRIFHFKPPFGDRYSPYRESQTVGGSARHGSRLTDWPARIKDGARNHASATWTRSRLHSPG